MNQLIHLIWTSGLQNKLNYLRTFLEIERLLTKQGIILAFYFDLENKVTETNSISGFNTD